MASWIEFLEQHGDGKNYALLDIDRTDDGKVTLHLYDTTTRSELASHITLRTEQIEQLKGFLNHED